MKVRIILIFFLIILSCHKEQKTNFFYTYIQSDPAKLDPFYSTDVISGRVMAKLFNGLFKIDKDGKLKRDLVKAYSFNGKTLKVTLKSNVLFHNMKPLSSEDVEFSFRRIWKSENPTSPRKWVFQKVKAIICNNKDTLTIELKKPFSTFLYLLTMPTCYIISKESYTRKHRITGTGPFTLHKWKHDEEIVLINNENYFDKKAKVKGVVFRIIPEDLTARFEFLNNTLDYFDLPYLSRLKFNRGNLRKIDVSEMSVHYIAFNTKKPPLHNSALRRAVNYSINRNAILKSLFNSRFMIASGPIPPVVGNYKTSQNPIPYNPEKAAKIISRLGLKGKRLTLLIKSDHQVSIIAQMLQHYMNRTGLRITIKEMEWSTLKAATMNGKFDMAYFTWHADYPEADNFLFPLFYSKNRGAGGNRSFYGNREVDRLLLLAQQTINRKKRFDIYRSIERLILGDSPWVFLWYGDKRIILSSRVKKFIPHQIYNGMKGNQIELY